MPGSQSPNGNYGLMRPAPGANGPNDPTQSPFFDQTGTGYYGGGNLNGDPRVDPNDPTTWMGGLKDAATGQSDPNSFGPNYTGQEDARFNRLNQYSQGLMGRGAPTMGVNAEGVANNAQDRSMQNGAVDMQRKYAMGQGPSVAQAQTFGALGSGAAAMNVASQGGHAAGAMAAGAPGMQSTAMQGGIARSKEQNGLMNAYGEGTNTLRKGDVGQYSQDMSQGIRSQGLSNDQNMLNAQTNLAGLGQEEQSEIQSQDFANALYQQQMQTKAQGDKEAWANGMAGANYVASMGGMSDRRAKTSIRRGLMGGC